MSCDDDDNDDDDDDDDDGDKLKFNDASTLLGQ